MKRALLGLLLLLACTRKIPTSVTANGLLVLKLTTIKADNLSEDLSGEDEIHLICWLVLDSAHTPVVLGEWQDSMVLYKNNSNQPRPLVVQDSIYFIDKTKLIVLVMEADTERPYKERAAIVCKVMEEHKYQSNNSLNARLTKDILDDDLLSLSFHKISSLAKTESGQILFGGNHLFDNYFYQISYTFHKIH